jgi:hypothetical protein
MADKDFPARNPPIARTSACWGFQRLVLLNWFRTGRLVW